MKLKIASIIASSIAAFNLSAAIVAVVDSGVDVNHEDLVDQILKNDLELNGTTGEDDDQNGYLDDINGWNFVSNNNLVLDPKFKGKLTSNIENFFKYEAFATLEKHGVEAMTEELKKFHNDHKFGNLNRVSASFAEYAHGTHVAGIVAQYENNLVLPVLHIASTVNPFSAKVNNFRDVESESPIASYFDEEASFALSNEIKSFKYASSRGADVINASFSMNFRAIYSCVEMLMGSAMQMMEPDFDPLKYFVASVKRQYEPQFEKIDALIVAAAGNDNMNNDLRPSFPASLKVANMITVGASIDGKKASFSNYGKTTVDVFAPGVAILSSVPGGHIYMNGTSQAAPVVSRIAGHMKDVNPSLTPKRIKKIIMRTVDKKDALKNKCVSGGVVNEDRAVYVATLMNDGISMTDAIKTSLEEIADEDSSSVKSVSLETNNEFKDFEPQLIRR